MPIVGAVLVLSEQPQESQAALEFLRSRPELTLGQPQVQGLPVVVESQSRRQDRALWESLEQHPGIRFISVVWADFSDIIREEEHEHHAS